MRSALGTFLLLIIFLGSSCTSDSGSNSKFDILESALKEDPSKENINNLLKAYNADLQENPSNLETYKKAYSLSSEYNMPSQGSYLLGLIKNSDANDENMPEWLYTLGKALEEQRKTEAAQIIYGNVIQRFPSHPQIAEMQEKVGESNPVEIVDRLTASRLENPDQYGLNKGESFKFVDACEAYAISNPSDPRSPEYIFDAAEIAKLLKTYNKALSLYDWLIASYPDYPKTPSALFIKAFTLENELSDIESAKAAYELFLEKYPDDNFADDARFSLENIGKSPDEVLKAIEAKAAQNQ